MSRWWLSWLGLLGLLGCSPVFVSSVSAGSAGAVDVAIRQALAQTRGQAVRYSDPLGEGTGAFDSDPRVPSSVVDCVVWV